ncbi:Hypothetical_protein [Hexamita inflata]|uniref:Hypothetical_protein n=1 Tax=Hexamita inflata TaxID=28002 RepID=A0AA86P627_9EUKA|nr:Hypothetical protein HINF_LOCUS18562 [Hexamita inflata]
MFLNVFSASNSNLSRVETFMDQLPQRDSGDRFSLGTQNLLVFIILGRCGNIIIVLEISQVVQFWQQTYTHTQNTLDLVHIGFPMTTGCMSSISSTSLIILSGPNICTSFIMAVCTLSLLSFFLSVPWLFCLLRPCLWSFAIRSPVDSAASFLLSAPMAWLYDSAISGACSSASVIPAFFPFFTPKQIKTIIRVRATTPTLAPIMMESQFVLGAGGTREPFAITLSGVLKNKTVSTGSPLESFTENET